MPDAEVLMLWVIIEVLSLRARSQAHLEQTGKTKHYATTLYLPGTLEAMIRSGFVRRSPTLVEHIVINPEVTEEQWEGLEVYYVLRGGAP